MKYNKIKIEEFTQHEMDNTDINELLKEYGIQPLQRIPRNLHSSGFALTSMDNLNTSRLN